MSAPTIGNLVDELQRFDRNQVITLGMGLDRPDDVAEIVDFLMREEVPA